VVGIRLKRFVIFFLNEKRTGNYIHFGGAGFGWGNCACGVVEGE
jgi:hypothetical protein